jgi:transposase
VKINSQYDKCGKKDDQVVILYKFRKKMVRLYFEEGYNTTVLREQFGVSSHSVIRWVKAYRERGS